MGSGVVGWFCRASMTWKRGWCCGGWGGVLRRVWLEGDVVVVVGVEGGVAGLGE